jgi:hypothetical protein
MKRAPIRARFIFAAARGSAFDHLEIMGDFGGLAEHDARRAVFPGCRRFWRPFATRLLQSHVVHCRKTLMPVVLRFKGFRFFFYSNEGSPREPVHIHVVGAGGEAKYWVSPAVALAESDGFDARTLKQLLAVVEENAELIERLWNEHFC